MSEQQKPKKDMADMTPAEISMRKFLKALGVTTHQKLEAALADAVASGTLPADSQLDITAKIAIAELGFSHTISAQIATPQNGD